MGKERRVHPWTRLPDYDDATDIIGGTLAFDADRCNRCNICASICPGRAIERGQRGGAAPALGFVAPELSACIACGCCLAACPDQAITITRPFQPQLYYQRLSQEPRLTYPRRYLPEDVVGGKTMPDASESSWKQRARLMLGKLRFAGNMLGGSSRFLFEEALRGDLLSTVKGYLTHDLPDISWAELLEHDAEWVPDKVFLRYKDEAFTYAEMDRNANRVARFLLAQGGGRGRGIGLLLRNSPRFLDAFFATQKIGMYSVPINAELRGNQLAHVIDHSDIETLLVEPELLPLLEPLQALLTDKKIALLIDDLEPEGGDLPLPQGTPLLSRAYEMPPDHPGVGHDPDDICLILYTSGTTGMPKGVVYRYRKTKVKMMCLGAQVTLRPSDVYYTAFPLSHGNALLATTTMAMGVKCTVALARKFSASGFWDDIRRFDATVFNTIGSIVPILLKQPEKPTDRQHSVRLVNSAGCPTDMWERFEKRFGVKIYEIYGAIDGGGKGIFNFGTAPVGSIGKPSPFAKYRIVDERGEDVPDGAIGELIFELRSRSSAVEYHKDPDATRAKSSDGWLYTGDLVRRDIKGYLYFVGRNIESMRKGGENVSAYEVEQAIMEHPAVEEVAVYAVPSELAEDEICAAIKRVEGQQLSAQELLSFLRDRLARFAIPRYVRFVDAFPKTNSHRIVKGELQRQGVTADTFDSAKREEL